MGGTRTSYAAGRWEQLQAVKAARPYWQYVHSDAVEHPRPLHQAWGDANLVLSADDPWWETHFPPNGWGCQCSVRALAERDLKRLGKTGPDRAPAVDMQTKLIGQRSPGGPREVQTPAGIDPGFAYAPGRDVWLKNMLSQKLQANSAPVTRDGWKPMLTRGPVDYGRPARLPIFPVPTNPIPTPTDAETLREIMRKAIGGARRLFDVKKLPVAVDADWISQHIEKDMQRSRFASWIGDLLDDPYEVWVQLERHEVTGSYRTRARVLKVYELGRGRGLVFVIDQVDGVLMGWTFFNSKDLNYVNDQRSGLLWYGGG